MKLELVYVIAPEERWTQIRKKNHVQISKPVEYYSVLTPEEDGGSEISTVRDMNRMWEISERLEKSFPRVMCLPEGSKRLFAVTIKAEKSRRDSGIYELDYHRYDGCPTYVSSDGMELYHEIGKIMKNASTSAISRCGSTKWRMGKYKNKKRKINESSDDRKSD